METQITTNEQQANFSDEEINSWNRPRTDEELHSFIETRHALLSDTPLFD